ncbi:MULTISPECIES: flagellar hook protein FlgE [unclassified Massilia]|uniref:flagellar hook protein FlgE n=1 Tax=unclassified Massilia TaxID=2609279 RepID=UPI00177EFC85|nr:MULTISPECIES: flagellar hook protein FlgE [unclassified Massilia]MBD8528810.1 flagellar hook protein FlgE [Massilia sp. CFBP 13647]MBD8673451.1 flagellar hook protein FlgE [Massilia sp. CFBP 13721]
MSFQQGLSGLNGAAKSLDVIGNNIANASTVGFKGAQAQFADVYASSLNGAGGVTAGIGVKVSTIAQQFTQGNIESSNNSLDVAINGQGFFRTVSSGMVQYTRNGQFALDKDGFMTNAQGAKLTGYSTGPSGEILAGAPMPVQISTGDLKPVATTKVGLEMNLDSRVAAPVVSPFDASDPNSYNKQSPVDVYDTLGNPHVLSTFYVKNGSGTWDVYAANDGTEVTNLKVAQAAQGDAAVGTARAAWETATKAIPPVAATIASALATYAAAASAKVAGAAGTAGADAATQAAIVAAGGDAARVAGNTPELVDKAITASVKVPAVPIGTLRFDENGALNAATTANGGKFTVALPIFPSTGAEPTQSMELAYTGTTQYGSATSDKKLVQDGYTAGNLQRFSIGKEGIILGQYSNGQSKPLGQVVLANFANTNGLEPLGNNAWAESANSGTPLIGTPNSGSFGVMQSSAVETSNVDLTAELVNMITAQRVYQANAQTIKTQDSVLQTLVSMR